MAEPDKMYENMDQATPPTTTAPQPVLATVFVPPPTEPAHSTVAALAAKYATEFEETLDGIRRRAIKLQERAPQIFTETKVTIEPFKEDFVNTIKATDEVNASPVVVFEALAWATILITASHIASVLSSYLLAPILSLAIGQIGAAALALIAAPFCGYWIVQKQLADRDQDVSIRFNLLSVALVEGLLVGFILKNSYLSGAPLAPILIGTAAVAYPFLAEKFGKDRKVLLAGSVGAGVVVSALIGLLFGQMTVPFLLTTLLYAVAIAVTLQFFYKNAGAEALPTYKYQLALLIAFTASNLLTHLLFGMSADAAAKSS